MKKPYEVLEKGDYTKPGVTRNGAGVNFTLAVKGEEKAFLLLYKKGTESVAEEIPLGEKSMGDLYSICLKGFVPDGYEYNYRIGKKVLVDPYAKRVVGRRQFGEWSPEKNVHQIRGGFDFSDYDWEGEKPLHIPYEDGILYQLHVRGFTKSPGSKVKNKGTFQGIVEKIPYFQELGINQLLLMPVYDFDERMVSEAEEQLYLEKEREPKLNYWGYGPGRFFAPKSTFASKDPVKEFKDMVKALHQAGIEVLLEMFFPEKTEERLMIRCLEHWRSAYHVDGFCLMGNQAVSAMVARDPMFSDTKLISPYFDVASIYTKRESLVFRNLAECNDGFLVDARRFLKGDEDQLPAFIRRTRKNPFQCAVVNYITNHDGFTLMDLVSYEERHNEANGEGNQDGPAYNFSWNCGIEGPSRKKKVQDLRLRQMKNAFLLLLFSQGTPMILAGDEFGNSQKGNNNPYCQDNEISWLDWGAKKRNEELFTFVKEAIAFRKSHGLLHQRKELLGTDTRGCGYPDVSYHGSQAWYGDYDNTSRHFGVMYCGVENGEDQYLYVAYNLHWKEQEFAVPKLMDPLKWEFAFGTEEENEKMETEIEWKEQKSFTVPPRTILVLIGRK